ncbi:branched-chain amino acid transport system II carrier protein [Fusobacterium sp.]|uniref:branched-chain amino acid transport system II carrier protein n=1 Tax=Fusobacterium sp. TaxID=68766 RepID=UPI00260AA800|nr:branched-chain amino acid transport system II carrier protein [Fusobacterium sp.]
MYKKKDVIITGFALFAMLFGAGNLIFPPMVGFINGDKWALATIGFILTGAGFPLLAIFTSAFAGKDLDSFAKRVSPKFSKFFNVALILAIGPLLALPRTGATAFEMIFSKGSSNYNMYKIIFIVVFFGVSLLFSLKSSKVVDRVGAILTPILLAVLAIIIFKGVFFPIGNSITTVKELAPFKYGFLNGYQTMDTLAAIVFSDIILKSIRKDKNLSPKQEFSFLLQTSLIAIGGLAIVYGGLSFIGSTITDEALKGAGSVELLTSIVKTLLGNSGKIILAICVTGACITTAIGLTATVADYFSELTKISYEKLAVITTVISIIFAMFGVDIIIKLAVPVLVFLYPIAIALIFLNIFKNNIKNDNIFLGTVIGAGVISGYEALQAMGYSIELFDKIYSVIPLTSLGLAWVLPAILGGVIFKFIPKK